MTKKREGLADWKGEIEFLRAKRIEEARLRRLKADYERSRGPKDRYEFFLRSECLFQDSDFPLLVTLSLFRYIKFLGIYC